MRPYFKVLYSDPNAKNVDLSPHVVTLEINKGTETKQNSVNIEFANPHGVLNRPGSLLEGWAVDKVSILVYLDWEPIDTSKQDPTISTIVTGFEFVTDDRGKSKLKVTGADKTSLLLSKIWAGSYKADQLWAVSVEGTTLDPDNTGVTRSIIHNIIGHINGLDEADPYYLTTNNVATKRSDGTPFPRGVDIVKIWKPAWEWLDELSGIDYTRDNRPYVYHIDENNDLHWHYPYQKTVIQLTSAINTSQISIPVTSTLTYPEQGTLVINGEAIYYKSKTSTTFEDCTRGYSQTPALSHAKGSIVTGQKIRIGKENIYKMNVKTASQAAYNFIIFNPGKTPKGYEPLFHHEDESQVGRKLRMVFRDYKSISNALFMAERTSDTWGEDRTTNYPNAYPYTTSWGITVESNLQYHNAFKDRLEKLGKIKCEQYFKQGSQKFEADIDMRGTKDYEMNEIVTVENKYARRSHLLRIKEIKHQVNKGSWITTIGLTEDPEMVQETT